MNPDDGGHGDRGRHGGRTNGRGHTLVAVGAVVALAVVHALVVAPRYHVGSFDDDASYVLAARALAAGHGLTSRVAGGYPLVGVYPPGYPALLAPLAAIWPSGVVAFRTLSLVPFVAVFPLTWVYLARCRVPERLRLAVLVLLALNPVLATYATMVMAETAFVVVLLLLLLAVNRWQDEPRALTWAGLGSVVCGAGLTWLKEAGVGLVIGVAVWLLVRRLYRKAVVAALAPAVLFSPLLIIRALDGANLIGSRYSTDLGGVVNGGPVYRVLHIVPSAAMSYVTDALPRSIMPTLGGFLPEQGPIGEILLLLAATAAPFVVAGIVVWCRRYRDVAWLAVTAYVAETLIYPYTNERRVVLVLPVIIAWYVLGAHWAFGVVRHAAGRTGGTMAPRTAAALPFVACLLALVILGSQFTRDYLYPEGTSSSSPGGSAYMALLRRLGPTHEVVETDYLWTTALYSGHRTANTAYLTAGCDAQPIADAIDADGAGYLLTGLLNGVGTVDDPCLLPVVSALPQAVRLYRTTRDQASVFELVGPGTAHPDVSDLTAVAVADGGPQAVHMVDEVPQTDGDNAGQYATLPTNKGAATLTWSWARPVSVSQLSLGAAGATSSDTTSVAVSVLQPDGHWQVLADASGAVGTGGASPFLLVHFPAAQAVLAARVTVTVRGAATVAIHDFHVLGATDENGPAAAKLSRAFSRRQG